MNDKQNAKLSMAQRVSDTLKRHEAAYAAMPPMAEAAGALGATITRIREVIKEQGAVNVAASTLEKRAAEGRMILPCVRIANALSVLGFSTDNKELVSLNGLSEASFYRIEDNAKPALAKRIVELARRYEAALSPYGIRAEELGEAEQATAAFESLLAKPRTAIGERKQRTSNLVQLFAELDSVLYDRLDKLMVLFKLPHPDFYGEYRTARNIIMS